MQSGQDVVAAYQTFLSHVYRHVNPQGMHAQSDIEVYQAEHICHTFGELLIPSLFTLLDQLELSADDVFLDLGSGLGKLALTVYLTTPIRTVLGVEGSKTYYAQAIECIQNIRQFVPDLFTKGKLELTLGNFLDFDFNQASIIYTCSTCFTQELLWLIGEKMNKAEQVSQVLSLKPIANLERLKLKKVIPVECSWDSALCYCYA